MEQGLAGGLRERVPGPVTAFLPRVCAVSCRVMSRRVMIMSCGVIALFSLSFSVHPSVAISAQALGSFTPGPTILVRMGRGSHFCQAQTPGGRLYEQIIPPVPSVGWSLQVMETCCEGTSVPIRLWLFVQPANGLPYYLVVDIAYAFALQGLQ